ncbi:hypothetical protein O6H91_08G036900 [Diphasiastrum complanatum]|uniref:Uncharacterized protein n=2 Tax=Diphasiastrum complanatum TaxID=34168 RepID=A0ACC2CWK0_DIPCM|nr:hypothetical protein O6H91_08G036900 [Diphasiastrum complanatum]KAJ7546355.1 hypothetical protein O6H91_08G036900 [Diphasiastrum complanatum]
MAMAMAMAMAMVMGVKQRLERAAGGLLRPWLCQDAQVRIVLSLTRLELLLESLQLDVQVCNSSSVMASCPALFQTASVDRLSLVLAPFSRRPLTLTVEGLHFVFCPRPAGDSYWIGKEEQREQQKRMKALTHIDPQGAAKHAVAMRLCEQKGSSSFYIGFVTELALCILRLELHKCSLELVTNLKKKMHHGCIVSLNTLILLEGNKKGITFSGGLFAAVLIQIIQSCWKYIHFSAKDGLFLTKFCSAHGLCLQLESKAASDEIGQSNTAELSSSTREVLGNDYEASASALLNETNQVLIFEALQVSLRYDQTCFHGLDFDIPDVILGLDNRDLEILLVFIAELQGSAVESTDYSLQKQQKSQISPKRSAKELWNLAVIKAIQLTPGHRLFQVLQSGSVRQRYAYLYGAWLREIGWRDQQQTGASSFQDKKKWEHSCVEKFSNAVAEVEKLLPVEAVALARTIAFHRIAASTIEADAPVSEMKAPYKEILKDHLALYGRLMYEMSQIVWKRIMSLSKCCRNRSSDENLDSGDGAPLLNQDIDEQTVTAHSVQVFFSIHICRGSLTVARAIENEVFLKKDSLKNKSRSSQPAISFTLERYSLCYGIKCDATVLRLISGKVAGSLVSVVPAKFANEIKEEEQLLRITKKHSKFDRWTVRGNDLFTFFSSSCISENVYSGKQLDGLSLNSAFQTSDWILKGLKTKQWCGWGLENHAQRDELFMDSTLDPCLSHVFVPVQNSEMPFLVADLQSPNANMLETNSQANTISSMLIVGEIVCSIKPSLLEDAGSIFCVCFKGDGPSTSATVLNCPHEVESLGHSSLPMEVLWSWGKTCVEKVEKFLSCLVPCSLIYFSAVLENPKLRLVVPETTLENCLQQEKTVTRKAAAGILKAGIELVLLVDCQMLELSMWPAFAKADDNSCPQVVDKFAKSRVSDKRQWLRRPKLAHLAEDVVLDAYSDHKQIGNNLLFSVASVRVVLEINSINKEVVPLLRPCNILMEASLCRDEFYSLFSAFYTLSADVSCKISALTVHLYVDEILLILQAFSIYRSALFDLYTIFDISRAGPESTLKNSHSEKGWQSPLSDTDYSTSQDRCFDYVSEDSLSTPWQLSSYILVSSISCSLLHVLLGSSRKIINNTSQTVLEQSDSNFGVANVGKVHAKNGKPKFTTILSAPIVEGHAYATSFDISCTLGESFFPRIYASLQQARLCILDQGNLTYAERQALNLQSVMHTNNEKDISSLSGDFFESRLDQDAVGSILTEVGVDYFTGTIMGLETSPLSASHREEDHGESVDKDEYEEKLQTSDRLKVGTSYEELSSQFSTKEASSSSPCSLNEEPVMAKRLFSKASRAEVTSRTTSNVIDVNFRLGKVLVTECQSQGLLSMISLMMPGAESMSVHLSIEKGFENVAMGTEGGIMVLHTEAVLVVLCFLGTYMQLLAKSDNAFSELSNDTSVHVAEKEQSAHNSTVNLEPFVSLPATVLSNNTTGLRRLYSAPPVTQESLHTSIPSEIEPLWRGVVSLKTSSFRLVLVTAAASSKTPEGFLMQMSVAANLEFLERTDKIAVNLIQLGVCSLQTNNSSDVYAGASHGTSVRIPQFGSMSISIGGADKIANSLLQSTSLEPAISITEAGIETGANDENNVSKIQDSINSAASPITLSSTSTSNDSFVDHPNCILECLKFTAFLERNTFTNSDSMWSRAWKGSCLLEGMEVVLTTSEIQMLLSLMDPLAEYSSTEKPKFDQSSSLTTSKGLGTESRSVLPEIPDGAIVAVKDAHEHLYISVEETPSIKGHYHLVGVWHYSLAGEKALFKVKYQKNQKKGAIWFSLLSVHAKDAEGEPFRLHFQPGSSVANLVTTNDGSWELWQSVAYKPMEEDLQGLDVNYTKMFNNLVYLINQKSKDSLAFVDGVLMLVRQPGNPFKLRIVANHSQLEMGVLTDLRKGKSSGLTCLTKEQQAVRETMIPQINCKAKTIAFTVLHSVGYGAHLLPLFQISFQDGKAVIQVGGHKVRIFSGCKVHLKHFEAQNSCW